MTRFIGEEGDHCVLKAGIVVGTPFDCPGMSARHVAEVSWKIDERKGNSSSPPSS